jgi:SOS-response transcriptional repressor LexA
MNDATATDRPPLTRRQAAVLSYIRGYRAEHGYSPLFSEIMLRFEIASTNGVTYHLKRLETGGYIRRQPNRNRGIRPTDDDGGRWPDPPPEGRRPPDLTRRQFDVLRFFLGHCREHGRPPTLRETAACVGSHHPNAARTHVGPLIRKGYLRRHPAIRGGLLPGPRSYELCDARSTR